MIPTPKLFPRWLLARTRRRTVPGLVSDDDEIADAVDIFPVEIDFDFGTGKKFEGVCVDLGAQQTVIALEQDQIYSKLVSVGINSKKSYRAYKFGDRRACRMGVLVVQILVSDSLFVNVATELVDADVLLLFGVDALNPLQVIICFEQDEIWSKFEGWRVDLVRKLGHFYIVLSIHLFYTDAELRRINRLLYHPSADRMFEVTIRVDAKEAAAAVLQWLENFQSSCHVFQREADAPRSFRVVMPDKTCVLSLMYRWT